MTQLQLPIVTGVASKLEAILQRCSDRVRVGSVYFDEANEQRARAIAAADAAKTTDASRNENCSILQQRGR
jgi:hypothetical protein